MQKRIHSEIEISVNILSSSSKIQKNHGYSKALSFSSECCLIHPNEKAKCSLDHVRDSHHYSDDVYQKCMFQSQFLKRESVSAETAHSIDIFMTY